MTTGLLLLSVSCKTLTPTTDLLDIDFPSFPIDTKDPTIKFSSEGNCIKIEWTREGVYALIPINKWEELVKYSVDVNTAKKKYKSLQKTKNAIQK